MAAPRCTHYQGVCDRLVCDREQQRAARRSAERHCKQCDEVIVYRGRRDTTQVEYLALGGLCGACRRERGEVR